MIGGGGLGTLEIALLGGDQSVVLQPSAQAPVATESASRPAADELADFVSVVLADTEETWNTSFQQQFNAGRY